MTKIKKEILIKTPAEVADMKEGGKKLAAVKEKLKRKVDVGVAAAEIEKLAVQEIKKVGGKASFKMVPGYSWATCVNINEGIVHGIPKEDIVFRKGDLVSVDVGLFYKGFHTDTSFSIGLKAGSDLKNFLKLGQVALDRAISASVVDNKISDISQAIEETLEEGNVSPIRALVGHGVGKELHEGPQIPCFTGGNAESPKIVEGMTFAIEVMYAKGDPKVKLDPDGWTISTADGTISALFEESIAVAKSGPIILTR